MSVSILLLQKTDYKKFMLLIVICVLLVISNTKANTIYVPDSFPTIQEAITAAMYFDTIIVRPGIYVENIDFLGKAIVVKSELGPDTTIINGNQSGSVVIFQNYEGTSSVIEGFTITNGSGTSDIFGVWGGGIYCYYTSPMIRNNIITGNIVFSGMVARGGGIGCKYANPTIIGNHITENYAIGDSYEFADGFGGGIDCFHSSPLILNNVIMENEAISYGGWGGGMGGGIDAFDSYPIIKNTIIANNKTNADINSGDGIYCGYCESAAITITNSVITGNGVGNSNEGIYGFASDFVVMNSIIWANNAPYIGAGIFLDGGSLTISYSDVQGGQDSIITSNNPTINWGEGMIDADPMFETGALSDYHLSTSSPCIDSGNPDAQYNDPEDPENPGYAIWPALGTIRNDMGAYGGPDAGAVYFDYGISKIVSPPDTVFTDTTYIPQTKINNYGWIVNPVDIECTIDSSNNIIYADTFSSFTIAPGLDTTISFSNWTVEGVNVEYIVKFSILAIDSNQSNNIISKSVYTVSTGIAEGLIDLSQLPMLYQNTPNPFSSCTNIRFTLNKSSNVILSIYNIGGQKIKVLLDTQKDVGTHTIIWDGCDDMGRKVPTGIYFVKLKQSKCEMVKKIILLR